MFLTSRAAAYVGVFVVVFASAASAQTERTTTADALERMKEALGPVVDGGALQGVLPVIVVGAAPAFEDTRASFPTRAVAALAEVFGAGNLRACEACMNPRLYVEDGRLEQNSVGISLPEIVALDARTRGKAAPARAAIWVDETPEGVAVRVVSLENGQILFAKNCDGRLREQARAAQNFTYTADVERRLRGDSLTHVFVDAALYPGQHLSLDVVDQFGDRNLDLAGVTFSVFDPIIGIGAVYYRIIPEAFNLTLGAQVVASVPTIAVSALAQEVTDVLDPPLTAVAVARLPIPQTDYAVLLTASTNGRIGVGVTLTNISFLPVLP